MLDRPCPLPPTPAQKSTKNASFLRSSKKCKSRPKMVPKGDPKSPKNHLKSTFLVFFASGTSKMRLREDLRKNASFLIDFGSPKYSKNFVNTNKNQLFLDHRKSPFWAPFWRLFGSPNLRLTPFGRPWDDFWSKKEGTKNRSIFDAHFLT